MQNLEKKAMVINVITNSISAIAALLFVCDFIAGHFKPVVFAVCVLALAVSMFNFFAELHRRTRTTSQSPASPQFAIALVGVQPDRSPESDKQVVYRSKLRITLKNDTPHTVEITQPDWRTTSQQVQLQPEFGWGYQIEKRIGGWSRNEWVDGPSGKSGGAVLAVSAGWTFRVWIGVNQAYPDENLLRRHAGKQLGTLVLPARIDGQEHIVQFEL